MYEVDDDDGAVLDIAKNNVLCLSMIYQEDVAYQDDVALS